MRKEIELLGALHIAMSIIYIFISISIFAVLFSKGFFNNTEIRSTQSYVVCAVAGAFLVIFAFCDIIAAMGIMTKKPWSEMMMLILGCLNLVCIPLGTGLGIYTIIIFMRSEKMASIPLPKDNFIKNPDTDQIPSLNMEIRLRNKKDPL